MSRIVLALAAALCLAACGNADKPVGEPVTILTDEVGCFAGGESGIRDTLVADAKYGTAFAGKQVMWPTGYTGWRGSDGEVTVLDASGAVKAITGRKYYISVGLSRSLGYGGGSKYVAAAECKYHHDFIDCTANPTDQYCKPE